MKKIFLSSLFFIASIQCEVFASQLPNSLSAPDRKNSVKNFDEVSNSCCDIRECSIQCCDDDQCCELSTFVADLYYRGTVGKGIGRVNSYQTLGLYADWGTGCLQPFIDIRGHFLGHKQGASNLGLGLRYIDNNAEQVYGINVFYDYRYKEHNYHQIGLGLEYSGKRFDIFANYYSPVGQREYFGSRKKFEYPGGFFAIRSKQYEVFYGEDIEIGTSWNRWFCHSSFDLYASVGLYHYHSGNHGIRSITGERYRVELSYLDLITLGITGTHDQMFANTFQGMMTINFAFDQKGLVLCREIKRTCFINGITGKPVRRQSIIVEAQPECCWDTNF